MMGVSQISMIASLPMPFVHIGVCSIFVDYYGWEMRGCGIAMTISLTVSLIAQYRLINYRLEIESEENQKILKVKLNDPRVNQEMKAYFMEGMHNLITVFFRWLCFFMVTLWAGQVGPLTQTCVVINQTIQMFIYAVPLGVNCAASALIAQFIGDFSLRTDRKIVRLNSLHFTATMGVQVQTAKMKINAIIIFQFLVLVGFSLIIMMTESNLFTVFTSIEQL